MKKLLLFIGVTLTIGAQAQIELPAPTFKKFRSVGAEEKGYTVNFSPFATHMSSFELVRFTHTVSAEARNVFPGHHFGINYEGNNYKTSISDYRNQRRQLFETEGLKKISYRNLELTWSKAINTHRKVKDKCWGTKERTNVWAVRGSIQSKTKLTRMSIPVTLFPVWLASYTVDNNLGYYGSSKLLYRHQITALNFGIEYRNENIFTKKDRFRQRYYQFNFDIGGSLFQPAVKQFVLIDQIAEKEQRDETMMLDSEIRNIIIDELKYSPVSFKGGMRFFGILIPNIYVDVVMGMDPGYYSRPDDLLFFTSSIGYQLNF